MERGEDAEVCILVLLIEGDGTDERLSMTRLLADQDCVVQQVGDPLLAVAAAEATWPDLVVVNTCSRLPNVAEMCAALDRSNLNIPRLVVSESESSNSLRASAHLEAPFTARRLAYRLRKAIGTQANRFLRADDVVVDTLKHNVKCRGHVSHLTPKELALLGFLMKHADREVSRTEIMKEVWETEYMGDTRTLEVHIRWLRRKLEDDTKRPIRIVTVRRVGYRFQSPR